MLICCPSIPQVRVKVSRWTLTRVLQNKLAEHPIYGSGGNTFGGGRRFSVILWVRDAGRCSPTGSGNLAVLASITS